MSNIKLAIPINMENKECTSKKALSNVEINGFNYMHYVKTFTSDYSIVQANGTVNLKMTCYIRNECELPIKGDRFYIGFYDGIFRRWQCKVVNVEHKTTVHHDIVSHMEIEFNVEYPNYIHVTNSNLDFDNPVGKTQLFFEKHINNIKFKRDDGIYKFTPDIKLKNFTTFAKVDEKFLELPKNVTADTDNKIVPFHIDDCKLYKKIHKSSILETDLKNDNFDELPIITNNLTYFPEEIYINKFLKDACNNTANVLEKKYALDCEKSIYNYYPLKNPIDANCEISGGMIVWKLNGNLKNKEIHSKVLNRGYEFYKVKSNNEKFKFYDIDFEEFGDNVMIDIGVNVYYDLRYYLFQMDNQFVIMKSSKVRWSDYQYIDDLFIEPIMIQDDNVRGEGIYFSPLTFEDHIVKYDEFNNKLVFDELSNSVTKFKASDQILINNTKINHENLTMDLIVLRNIKLLKTNQNITSFRIIVEELDDNNNWQKNDDKKIYARYVKNELKLWDYSPLENNMQSYNSDCIIPLRKKYKIDKVKFTITFDCEGEIGGIFIGDMIELPCANWESLPTYRILNEGKKNELTGTFTIDDNVNAVLRTIINLYYHDYKEAFYLFSTIKTFKNKFLYFKLGCNFERLSHSGLLKDVKLSERGRKLSLDLNEYNNI